MQAALFVWKLSWLLVLADVFAYAFMLAEKYNFDVKEIILEKIKKNAAKYPIDKAKGTAKKYNELLRKSNYTTYMVQVRLRTTEL